MDENGLTCLSAAMHDVVLVRLLIKHGADITLGRNPVLLSAIDTQDIATIAMLLEAGANCNMLVKKPNDAFNHSAFTINTRTWNTIQFTLPRSRTSTRITGGEVPFKSSSCFLRMAPIHIWNSAKTEPFCTIF